MNKMNEKCVKQDEQAKCEQQNQQRCKMNKQNVNNKINKDAR
jgi:hypothetical protein